MCDVCCWQEKGLRTYDVGDGEVLTVCPSCENRLVREEEAHPGAAKPRRAAVDAVYGVIERMIGWKEKP